ncbi:hypothetical protein HETIRDRAFT_407946 [Heterobasidion irregulare TC 32-1]|uniref:Phytocyanin domain-containing protein n=1 Tax=Heterobasidion irregulare (strain TC 32-1) TaxID=747525 RepID=W4KLS4_HETIT|nr:uncharacterized protein HETIRDRAFT_407946 [Heterobasidion irregulare TC 32-1]ETW86305.1 hypothetical protein HETIRDRAFT_407946 [Heterobasidion irregulare TC 32-1]
MRFSLAAAVLPVLAASVSAQTTIQVQVGANNGLTYTPESVNATVGDTIQFLFMSKNHTVTQSSFASPCANLSTGGIDSGFQAVAAGAATVPSWSFTVNDTSAPLWFYCRQVGHCAKGMVFAVNPTAAKTFTAFQAAANASGSTTTSASGSAASGSAAATGSSSASSSATSPSGSATTNGAMAHGARAGAVLAALGFAAGLVL